MAPAPGRSSDSAATVPVESRSALAALQARLQKDFAGTPVQVDLLAGNTGEATVLRVVVPQPHGFEVGRSAVRPALGAVLDRLLPALREHPRWTVGTAGPVDPKGAAWLGADRGAAVRDYLVARGVAVTRFTPPQRQDASLTELRISTGVSPAR